MNFYSLFIIKHQEDSFITKLLNLSQKSNFQNGYFCLFCVFESICGKVGEIFFILVLSIGQKYGDDICFLPDTFPLKCRNVGFKQFEEYSMQVILCVGPMPPLDDSE